MLSSVNNAGIFLVSTLFDLYIFVLIIRLILVFVRADYYNPLSQFVIKLSQKIINPLRRIIPNIGNLELSTVLVVIILSMIKFLLIGAMTTGIANFMGLFILAIADSLKTFFNVFFYAILLQAIMSWIQPGFSPMGQVLAQITSPIMRPIRRLIPTVGGFDISPIPALIGLQLLSILLIAPLFTMGVRIAFG